MTIRASLLWVLAFFSFMLVIGAALGVLSLRISNGTLAELKQSQELDDALGRVVLSYKDALNGLSRAASSNYADIVRNVGQATLPTAGLAGEAAGLLQRAKASLNKGQAEYEYYKSLAARRRGRIAQGNRRVLQHPDPAGPEPAGRHAGKGRHARLPDAGADGAGHAGRPLRARHRGL